MLTTTRREIVNDYEISQNRQLRSFASDFDYDTQAIENHFEDKMEVRPVETYMSRDEIAQKLYGNNYSEQYVVDHNDENYSDPDLMPSITTMQITRSAYYQQSEQSETKSASKQGNSARSKILFASYAAVFLAFALIITLTIVSLSSLFVPAQPEQEVAQVVETVEDQLQHNQAMADLFDVQ